MQRQVQQLQKTIAALVAENEALQQGNGEFLALSARTEPERTSLTCGARVRQEDADESSNIKHTTRTDEKPPSHVRDSERQLASSLRSLLGTEGSGRADDSSREESAETLPTNSSSGTPPTFAPATTPHMARTPKIGPLSTGERSMNPPSIEKGWGGGGAMRLDPGAPPYRPALKREDLGDPLSERKASPRRNDDAEAHGPD